MATGPALAFGQLTFPLNQVTNTVGRKDRITNMVPDVDLVGLDQERGVSRRHAEVSYEHGIMSLRDVGSTNGSTINGERLALQVDRQLKDGDAVGFGGVNMTFVREAVWPEGVEAEWPPEVQEATPEETMIAGPGPEETMVAGPMAEETMVAPPGAAAKEPEPTAAEPEPAAAEPEPEPVAAAPAVVEALVACSNHSHLPAVGLCPGCLEPFCVDCLPEREDGLMVCNRCAGISYRLAVAVQAVPAPAAAAAAFAPAFPHPAFAPPAGPLPAPAGSLPEGSALPAPAPMPGASVAPEDGEKKKRWPF